MYMLRVSLTAAIHRIYSQTHEDRCHLCPDANSAEDLMSAEDRHIKSVKVCMSANCGSSLTIVAYDIREDVSATIHVIYSRTHADPTRGRFYVNAKLVSSKSNRVQIVSYTICSRLWTEMIFGSTSQVGRVGKLN